MNNTDEIPEVPVTLPPPRFANPFQGLKGDPTAATVNCLIPKEVFNRVKSCRLEGGTIQTTMNHLWIKLVNLLNQKGIESYADVREFEDAVTRSILVLPEDIRLPGEPTPQPNAAASVGDDAGAAERLRDAATSKPEQSDAPRHDSKGSGKRKQRSKRGKN